jgi:hypothetical protein
MQTSNGRVLASSTYDTTKDVVQVGLPAAATLYYTVAGIWGFPFADEVVATLAAVALFLGVVLKISASRWNHSDERVDGTLNVVRGDEKMIQQLDLQTEPADLAKKDELVIKVNKVEPLGGAVESIPPTV